MGSFGALGERRIPSVVQPNQGVKAKSFLALGRAVNRADL